MILREKALWFPFDYPFLVAEMPTSLIAELPGTLLSIPLHFNAEIRAHPSMGSAPTLEYCAKCFSNAWSDKRSSALRGRGRLIAEQMLGRVNGRWRKGTGTLSL